MQIIPLAAVPAQNLAVTLASQAVQISLYLLGAQDALALYMDLLLNGMPVFTARQVRAYGGLANTKAAFLLSASRYYGFVGDLLFLDTQASASSPTADPLPAGLGTRWPLLYLSAADLSGAGLP